MLTFRLRLASDQGIQAVAAAGERRIRKIRVRGPSFHCTMDGDSRHASNWNSATLLVSEWAILINILLHMLQYFTEMLKACNGNLMMPGSNTVSFQLIESEPFSSLEPSTSASQGPVTVARYRVNSAATSDDR